MNTHDIFDDFSKLLASGMPRRAMLRSAAALAVAALLNTFGFSRIARGAAPRVTDFQDGDRIFFNCRYEQYNPVYIVLDRKGCKDAADATNAICSGLVRCDTFDVKRRVEGWSVRAVVCDGKEGRVCPSALECHNQREGLATGMDNKPKIR